MKESCSIVTEFGYQAGHVFQDYILTFFSKKISVDGGAASRAVVPPPTEGLRLLGMDFPFFHLGKDLFGSPEVSADG